MGAAQRLAGAVSIAFCAALLLQGCATSDTAPQPARTPPPSASQGARDWNELIDAARARIQSQGCAPGLDQLTQAMRDRLQVQGVAGLPTAALRQLIRAPVLSVAQADPACVAAARRALWMLRILDDDRAMAADETARTLGPALAQKQFAGLRIGDVILYRDDTPVSAAITQVATVPTDFSHAALVVAGENLDELYVVDVVLGAGVVIEPLETWMKQEFLRAAIYRPRDARLGQYAAWAMLDLINRQNLLHRPYDYAMNLHDATEIFCTEVLTLAYSTASRSQVRVPRYTSEIGRLNEVFPLYDMGVRQNTIFLADDIELDPHFEPLIEVRDTRSLRRARGLEAGFRRIFAGLRGSERAQWLEYIDARAPAFGVSAMYAIAGQSSVYERMGPRFSARIVGMGRLGQELEKQLREDPDILASAHPEAALAFRLYSPDIINQAPAAGGGAGPTAAVARPH